MNRTSEYWAGFFDGEGTVRINVQHKDRGRKWSPSYRLDVQVTNTHLGVLMDLQQEWGGSLLQRKKRIGERYSWVWQSHTSAAARFLQAVLPFLVVKAEEVVIALEFIERGQFKAWGHKGVPVNVLELRAGYKQQLESLRSDRSVASGGKPIFRNKPTIDTVTAV